MWNQRINLVIKIKGNSLSGNVQSSFDENDYLTLIFRLVNMLDKTKLDQKNVWKIVRQIRKSFLSQNTDPEHQTDIPSLLSDYYIKQNIDLVEEKLKLLNTPNTKIKDISDETLKFAANLFTYLNYFPSKDFYVFISVIKSESAKNILLALTSMVKTSQNAVKKSSTKIFTRTMDLFNLTFYRDMDVITKGKGIDNWRNDSKYYHETVRILGQIS